MRCPHCHADIPPAALACPQCGKAVDASRDRVLEPELVDDHNRPIHASRGVHENGYDASGGFTHIFTFSGGQGIPPACLPGMITLVLALCAALSFGLLAGIGFVVFAALGRVITFFMSIRHILEGRFFNPWIPHLLTWLICWMLVAWLSGNAG